MAACVVLSGAFAFILQGVLFLTCLLVLAYKYRVDGAGRTPSQFALDSSKQCIGAGWTHVMNMGIAILLGTRKGGDECAWYWLEIVVDCTIGVAVEFLILTALMWFVRRVRSRDAADKLSSGVYVDDAGRFMLFSYLWQLAVWLVVVLGMKIVMVLLLLACQRILIPVAELMLRPFMGNATLKLTVVMIFTPAVMNALQFWLQDNIFVHAAGHARRPLQNPRHTRLEHETNVP